jgi:secretion/DNA translocation related TadE-like protein
VGDRGSASVVCVAVIGCLFLGLLFALRFGEAVVVRHRVGAAADLAALAAAGSVGDPVLACSRARVVVRRMAAGRLVRCEVLGGDVLVEVVGSVGAVVARAGPA